ncbi:MAG TPA: GMC family oxidoreductase N-terminal domain-containing protein [Solirubrobacteraceae bacterium]|jgi:choline dehydrogenase-like flavoprotein
MDLTRRQRRALEQICDAFCPSGDGLPSASELGVPDAVLAALARNPRASERKQLATLLSLWDSVALGALGGAGLKRWRALSADQRERVLLAWADSRAPQRRAVFQALRKAALLFYYMLPGPGGARNPAWDAVGYDGPLGTLPDARPKALTTVPLDGRDIELDCDVVIVGSGAGGGATAAVLTQAGLDVIVVESGDYYDDQDFDGSELGAITRYYMAAPTATHDQSVGLIAGACLGGGTVVNYTTSFRTPDEIRSEWASHGVPAFTSEDYTASLDAVCERLGVSQEYNDPSTREQKLRDGCIKLGWHVDAMPRGVRNCAQGKECGYCGLGCRVGAKQSVVKTWLSDAHAGGAKLVVRSRVRKVVVEGGTARGIIGVTADGRRLTIRSRAVVAACGAIHTPALLRRSGLQNANIGKHLRLHPAGVVFGVFDEELKPWEGVMQALYSDQFRDLDDGYGLKYETAAQHPHLFVPFAPWRGAREHFGLMEAISSTVPIGVLLRDRDGGEVRVGRDGEPVVRYKLSEFDADHLRTGIDGAAQMLEAAGARRVFSSHAKWVGYEPATGTRSQFMSDADSAGYGAGQVVLNSFHIMGSARMGGSPATSACDPTGQTWEVRGLYVLDGSSFPSASGVNPQISIQAIAHMCARGLAAHLH